MRKKKLLSIIEKSESSQVQNLKRPYKESSIKLLYKGIIK